MSYRVVACVLAVAVSGCTEPLFEARIVEVVADDCIRVEEGLVSLGGGMVGDPDQGTVTGRSWTRVFPWVKGPVVAAVGDVVRGGGGVSTRPEGHPCGGGRADVRVDGFCATTRSC